MSSPAILNTFEASDSDSKPSTDSRIIPTILRLFGASVLISSLSIFLFDGWDVGDGLHRFLTLIAFSSLLTGAGLVCAKVIGENVGARLFLGITLLSVIVNFSVAGSLIYSKLQFAFIPESMPGFAVWNMTSDISVIAIALAALAALTPIAVFCFKVLARKSSATLLSLFVLANALLLLPLRDPNLAALVGAIGLFFMGQKISALGKIDASLSTLEGRFAKLVTVIPLFILIGRSLIFYGQTPFALGMAAGIVFMGLRETSISFRGRQNLVKYLDCFSMFVAALGAVLFSESAQLIFTDGHALQLPSFSILFALALTELSLRSAISGTLIRKFAAVALALGLSLNLLIYPVHLLALVNTALGIGILVYGISSEQKLLFLSGLSTAVVGVLYEILLISEWFHLGNWLSLALLGSLIILLASLIERHGANLSKRISTWRAAYCEWQE